MDLGAFSMSLAVKNLEASKAFYGKLGFEPVGGGDAWQILRNGDHVIGLFEGMFEHNVLTFNPGWDQQGQETGAFTDVRELQSALQASGVEILSGVDASSTGPGSLMVMDPDGNPILIDQHR
jgi:catechol 2,3-dioxygenase-like lactoylglutathione lyase family enzyme